MDLLWQDLRFGIRSLRNDHGFLFACVAALGLGIGSTTAIFSVIDNVLLNPFPYANSERIYGSGLSKRTAQERKTGTTSLFRSFWIMSGRTGSSPTRWPCGKRRRLWARAIGWSPRHRHGERQRVSNFSESRLCSAGVFFRRREARRAARLRPQLQGVAQPIRARPEHRRPKHPPE